MKLFSALFLMVLTALYGYAQSGSGCIVHQYDFDKNFDDESSKKNHLQNYGATFTRDRFGMDSMAVHLSGGQYLEGGIDSLPYNKEPRTIALWLYLDLDPDSDVPVVYGSTAPAGAYGMTFGTNLDFKGQSAMRHFAWGMTADHGFLLGYPVQQWFHLAITYDGDTAKTYMNGSLEANSARNWNTKSYKFLVGKNLNNNPKDDFNGSIDDLRIYNCALSESEISDLAKNSTNSINKAEYLKTGIYPNPGFNEMILSGEKPIEEIRIVSSTGQILYFDQPRSTSLKINTSEYSGGLYYVIVKSQNNLQTIKWMKQ